MNETETLSPALPNRVGEATRRLLAKACEREPVLATAESCIGGLLASLLTDVPGVAHAFDRGFVTYSADSKTSMLGVPAALIEAEGAEPGLVHFACARAGLISAHREAHFGAVGRGAVRVAALEVAVEMMTEML